MPSVTNADRPAPRASTRVSGSVQRQSRATTGGAGSSAAKPARKSAVVKRTVKSPVEESAPPANMRSLSMRNVMTVCDSVGVSGRFEGQSRCSAVAPDTTVWTGESNGAIVIRLAPSGMEVGRINQIGRAVPLVLLQVSGRMWAAYSDGALRVFDYATQAIVRESTQHTAAVYAMCAADGFVYTGGADWKVYQWEADDMHFCRMYYGHRNTVRSLTTYTDQESGRRYVVSGSDDGTVKVWDASMAAATPMKKGNATAEKDAGCVATLDGQGRGVLSMLVLEDTAELWVGSEDTAIRVWDLYSMTITSVITAHRTPVVTMQRVEETIWSGSKDGTLVIVNRFTKEVVHMATQPPTSSTGAQQRFNMAIQPVTRTVVYNVWATGTDGSWQCWNFTAPESGKPYSDEDAASYPADHYLSQGAPRRSQQHASAIQGSSSGEDARPSSTAVVPANADAKSASNSFNSGVVPEDDAELRQSVARTRQSVAELLTEPAEVSYPNKHADPQNSDDEDDEIAIDAVAESIRNDRAAETQREMERHETALAREAKRAEKLRAQLVKMGQDPDAVAQSAAAAEAPMESASSGSPTVQRLEELAEQLTAAKARNAAMAAAAAAGTATA